MSPQPTTPLTPLTRPDLFQRALRRIDRDNRFATVAQALACPYRGPCVRALALALLRDEQQAEAARRKATARQFDARRAAANDFDHDTDDHPTHV
ncbi:MAG: hypothetical protein LW768_10835 [Rubrivivax sp.]|jgi:hypothetical protein|nr:hypothetical protein [Rubrivivax sp.]